MAIWDAFLSERDKRILSATGSMFGMRGRVGFGKRPALMLIDNTVSAVGDEPMPIEESIKTYQGSMGLEAWAAVEQQVRLMEVARTLGMPIIHTNFEKGINSPLGFYESARITPNKRNSRRLKDGRQVVDDFTPKLTPGIDDIVILKMGASAFLGTSLLAVLHQFGIDTILVGGNSTSGCVRATVCDGGCLNFRMIVVEQCVYDRTEAAHAMSLFDMDQKYGDVRDIEEVIAWLQDPTSDLQFPPRFNES